MFASPENVILKKLIFYQNGGSDKHLRACASILLVQEHKINQSYLEQWAGKLGVADELKLVSDRLREESE